MSMKIHFLDSHIDFFTPNIGAVSDEYDKRFHQQIKEMEIRYQGKETVNMLADYYLTLPRDNPGETDEKEILSYQRENIMIICSISLVQY